MLMTSNLLTSAGHQIADAGRHLVRHPGSAAGAGAAVGAVTGAALGARREAQQQPAGQRNYLGAALRGGVTGGAVGGALGGAAGLASRATVDTMLLNPNLSGAGNIATATAKRVGTGISNMAQRQFHGLTGYGSKDHAYLDRIGVQGTQSAKDEIRLMSARFKDNIPRGGYSHEQIMAHEQMKAPIREQGAIGQRFRDLGMTSVPGAIKGMATNPREASKAIWNQIRSGGTAGVALGVGVPAVMGATDIARGDESATGGRTIGQKVISNGANIGSGLLFSGLPMGASTVAGMAVDSGAHRLGNLLHRPTPQIAPPTPA